MKTIFMLMLTMGVLQAGFSNGIDPASAENTGTAVVRRGSTFKLLYKNDEKSNVQVAIFNDSEKIIFTERLKATDGFIRPYNFRGLKHGEYTIVVTSENGSRYVERVEYKNNETRPIVKIVKLKDSEKYMLMIPYNYNGNSDLSIRIHDEDGNKIYEGAQHLDGDFCKLYNLSGVYGTITFTVTNAEGKSSIVRF